MNPFRYDFGYEWFYSYGHLIPVALGLLIFCFSVRSKRRRWLPLIGAVLAIWGIVGLLIVQFALRFNLPAEMRTAAFLQCGEGKVLDVGAGSGRASVMVLVDRPRARVVALDFFQSGYGIGENTPERARRNAAIAGAAERFDVVSSDMRSMPFPDHSFDAAVSTYAIDHMRRADSARALREVNRVLRPGGELLLEIMAIDGYTRVAFPILSSHGFFGPNNAEFAWRDMLQQADFELLESGRAPGAIYFLARTRTQVR